jgi:hypothetical protein
LEKSEGTIVTLPLEWQRRHAEQHVFSQEIDNAIDVVRLEGHREAFDQAGFSGRSRLRRLVHWAELRQALV